MNMVVLLALAALLVVSLGILGLLLHADHEETVKELNKKIILRGGKNVNPFAAANGDGIIGENMNWDDTLIKTRKGVKSAQMLCLTDVRSRMSYRSRFCDKQIFVGRMENFERAQEDGRLYVNDTRVSRVHCRIYLERDGYMVEDCHSTNHTEVNGKRITGPVKLRSGDLLRLANKSYRVQFLQEHTG